MSDYIEIKYTDLQKISMRFGLIIVGLLMGGFWVLVSLFLTIIPILGIIGWFLLIPSTLVMVFFPLQAFLPVKWMPKSIRKHFEQLEQGIKIA